MKETLITKSNYTVRVISEDSELISSDDATTAFEALEALEALKALDDLERAIAQVIHDNIVIAEKRL